MAMVAPRHGTSRPVAAANTAFGRKEYDIPIADIIGQNISRSGVPLYTQLTNSMPGASKVLIKSESQFRGTAVSPSQITKIGWRAYGTMLRRLVTFEFVPWLAGLTTTLMFGCRSLS